MTDPRSNSKAVAILAADAVGYSNAVANDEALALRSREIVGGNVGKMVGFGFAAAFGAVCGLVAGHYFVPAVPDHPLSFWLVNPIRYGHWPWALGVTIAGIVIRYLMAPD